MPAGELVARVRHGLKDHRLYSTERVRRGRRARVREVGRNIAIGLGARTFLGEPVQFDCRGFTIPLDLAEMTGGVDDTWEEIALAHLDYCRRWAPIGPDDAVLDIGCGIGRDAIYLAGLLSTRGRYVGMDIIEPSVTWCQRNITRRHPNFEFVLLDSRSEMYNPTGARSSLEVEFPLPAERFDLVFLHSVFTHMFADDIAHYLSEIARVLRPTGKVLASFFVFDDPTLAAAQVGVGPLRFRHEVDDDCRINDPAHPEAAVAYTADAIGNVAESSGLGVRGVHRGFWSGLDPEAPNGQDVVIMERR